ncbi:MAG TPA: tetratricopeptide repeat protein [Elusimicrobiota bacterium]|jgi:TolA-binding protein|nr:tetratricopeptide repeat protein [Elusimicrobiota bacterium]
MELNIRKWFFSCALVIGGMVLVHDKYTPQRALAFTHAHRDPRWAPTADFYIGMAAYLQDQRPEAEAAFRQLIADFPKSPYVADALYRLGDMYSDQNRWPEARDAFQQYMDSFPNGDKITLVRNRWEYIKFR